MEIDIKTKLTEITEFGEKGESVDVNKAKEVIWLMINVIKSSGYDRYKNKLPYIAQ